MNEAKLILDIGADVSQFEYSLARVRAEIKSITKDIESATGTEFAKLSVDLTGLERTQDTLLRFGQFAEGTLGALKNQLATLKQERLEIPVADTARLEEYGRKIDDTGRAIKNLENLGREKIVDIIDPVAINSIQFFRQELDLLNSKKIKINIDTAEGRAQMAAINSSILYYKERIQEANALGQTFDPIPDAAINSINYFKQQIDKLESIRASISIDTAEGRIQIAELQTEIQNLKNRLKDAQAIGKATEFIDLNTIAGLQARLNEINALVVTIDVTDEGQIAALNTEAEQLRQQIARLQGLSLDSKGTLVKGAAKARQSLVNLGLVAQDLPFGFIAIQNNIPNLVQSLGDLSLAAKESGVSVGSQLAAQFKGGAGAILGIGLAFTALTATITYLIQKYGSLGAAFDAFFGKVDPLAKVVKRADKALKDFTESFKTAGEAIGDANASAETEIVRLEALAEVVQDVTKTERARKTALEELKQIDNDRFGRYDIESGKLQGLTGDVIEYTNAVIAKSVAEKLGERTADALAARETQRNLYGERLKQLDALKKEYPNVEKAVVSYEERVQDYLNAQKKGGNAGIGPTQSKEVKRFLELRTEIREADEELQKLNDTYVDSRTVFKNATLESLAFGESLTSFSKKQPKKIKIKFDYDLPKLEEFLIAEEFYDPRKSLTRLEDYADIVLDVSKKESERTDALAALNKESLKVTNGSFKLFETLKIGKSSTDEIKTAVEGYGFELQRLIIALIEAEKKSKIKFKFELPKTDKFLNDVEDFFKFESALKRLEDAGQVILDPKSTIEDRTEALKKLQSEQKLVFNQDSKYFDNLEIGISSTQDITNAILAFGAALQQALIDKKSISDLFDSNEIKTQIESIKELSKGLPKELVPDFKFYEQELTRIFTLEFLKAGKPIDPEIIKEKINTALNVAKDTIKKAQINKALAELFGNNAVEVPVVDQIDNIINSVKKFEETIANDLEKPFRNFFDTLLEDGEVNFKAFGDLFKDMIKRMMSQLIASGIAKLITSILFPEKAVLGAVTGVANGTGGPTGILKFITDLFGGKKGAANNVNFGGVGNGGLQLAGQVVFTQRGSDLVGVLNRTNSTINRIG